MIVTISHGNVRGKGGEGGSRVKSEAVLDDASGSCLGGLISSFNVKKKRNESLGNIMIYKRSVCYTLDISIIRGEKEGERGKGREVERREGG